MPCKSRIDAPGALQHVIARGINRQWIFRDDADKNSFLDRLSGFLKDCGIQCYAWAILDNHFHLLLRSGVIPGRTVRARSLLCYCGAGELRMSMTGLSAQLKISVNCVSQSVARGKILAKMNDYSLT